MADLLTEDVAYRKDRTAWGAIWAGVFIFMAIWFVFGSLGITLFANATQNPARSILGMSTGIGIWIIVLTIVAMYIAARETSHLSGVNTRRDGLVHGMIVFGLSAVALFLLTAIGGNAVSTLPNTAAAPIPYIFTAISNLGWMGFASLLLGWLAALLGGYSGSTVKKSVSNVRDIRNAA